VSRQGTGTPYYIINIGTGKSGEAQEKAERGIERLREGKLRQGHG